MNSILKYFLVFVAVSYGSWSYYRWPQTTNCQNDSSCYVKLSTQWQPGICRLLGCNRTPEPRFSIHGLWEGQQIDNCKDGEEFQDSVLEDSRLVRQLDQEWPSLKRQNRGFWAYQYRKHGRCSHAMPRFRGTRGYLEGGLMLFSKVRPDECLSKARISPANDKSVSQDDLIRALSVNHQGRIPEITCGGGGSYLTEVRYCFNSNGDTPIDCPGGRGYCNNRITINEN